MRKTGVIILSAIIVGCVMPAKAQVEKYVATYMYNFISYMEWPAELRSGDFQIGVLGGGDPIVKELVATTMSKKVGSRKIVIVPFNSVSEISNCHILYIPARSSQFAGEAYEKVKSKGTLMITTSATGIEAGAAINFIVVDGKLNFEIKPDNAVNQNIRISKSLTNLAKKIIS